MTTDMPPLGSDVRAQRLPFLSEPRRVLLRRVLRPAPRGLLMRSGPVSRGWGFDRGLPIDRYFIERFLDGHRADISGRVLEVKDDGYTRRFGSTVTHAEVLDIDAANPAATVVADLTDAPQIPDERYDCVLLTQVLHQVYDVHAAVAECRRILQPGGRLLVTMPALSRCSMEPKDTDFWRVTPACANRLFGDVFGAENVEVVAHGNAVLGASFLMGLAVEEIPARQLRRQDPLFPVLVTIRAIRAA
jgi:SAM-dependent methyltransferase